MTTQQHHQHQRHHLPCRSVRQLQLQRRCSPSATQRTALARNAGRRTTLLLPARHRHCAPSAKISTPNPLVHCQSINAVVCSAPPTNIASLVVVVSNLALFDAMTMAWILSNIVETKGDLHRLLLVALNSSSSSSSRMVRLLQSHAGAVLVANPATPTTVTRNVAGN